MATESDVLNALGAAAFLGIHVETLRKLARRNEIPSFKIGRDWRFRKEALLRWADDHRGSVAAATSCSALIVDDEVEVCMTLGRSVEQIGFRSRWATSGAQGLDLVAQELPDVILLDLEMPGMNGPDFLEELRFTHPDLPVVIVTGFPESRLMHRAMDYAPIMLLAKPVAPELLERTLRLMMGDRMVVREGAGQ